MQLGLLQREIRLLVQHSESMHMEQRNVMHMAMHMVNRLDQ